MKEFLKNYFKKLNISLNDKQAEQFEVYKNILVKWNEFMNLTAITEDRAVAIKHFADSAVLLKYYDFKDKSVIDVGTGAGFPGLPVKIAEPSVSLTLLDSLSKRIEFLKEACKVCGIEANYIHGRAEELGRDNKYRQLFDIAVSRAVAPLNALCEYDMPYVKIGGAFIALKGPNVYDEINLAKNAVRELGGEISEVIEAALPDTDLKHTIVIINKIRSVPEKYPRRSKKIERSPL